MSLLATINLVPITLLGPPPRLTSSGSADGLAFWLALVGLVALITVGGALIFWARRWARGPLPPNRPGFTLEDLRAMYERGEITQREYDTARDTMLHRARTAARHEREKRGGTDWSGPEGNKPGSTPGR